MEAAAEGEAKRVGVAVATCTNTLGCKDDRITHIAPARPIRIGSHAEATGAFKQCGHQ